MRIYFLVDNLAGRNCRAEWGFSLFIEGKKIFFLILAHLIYFYLMLKNWVLTWKRLTILF